MLPQAISPIYSAAKFGVLGFSRAMGGYNKPYGIRVNCVRPLRTFSLLSRVDPFMVFPCVCCAAQICPSFTNTAMVHDGMAYNKGMAAAVKALGVMDVSLVTNVTAFLLFATAVRADLILWCWLQGMMELMEDDSKNAAVMRVTAKNGRSPSISHPSLTFSLFDPLVPACRRRIR